MKHACGALLMLLPVLAACDAAGTARVMPDADPEAGRVLITRFGCGTCHVIPGVRAADGLVGPPLTDWSRRVYLAGRYPNSPDNLVRWLLDPPRHAPATVMPDLDLSPEQARDIAAYLYEIE